MFNFEVGEVVRIINNNECYVDDPKMVAEHIWNHFDAACYCMSSQPEDDDIGKVIARWEDNGQNIYYVRVFEGYDCDSLSCYCYLMDETGLERFADTEIKEGDTVKVVEPGCVYADYVNWVLRNITDPDLLARWAYRGRMPGNDEIYKVVKIAPHSEKTGCARLAFIKGTVSHISYKCYLIGVDGLKKVKSRKLSF